MKTITREIKLNVYTFANVDVATGTLLNMFEIKCVNTLTRKHKQEISKDKDGAIIVKEDVITKKYSIPVEYFISACEEYARLAAEGEAVPITESDEEYTEEEDN